MVALLAVLLVFALGLMALLVFDKPRLLLPEPLRQSVGKLVGIDVLHGDMQETVDGSETGLNGWNESQWNRKPTQFVDDSRQSVDSSIFSQGFDDDGFERVMVRGQFGQWLDITLGELSGRAAFIVNSAGENREVYVGRTVKMYCTPKTWYDKYGQPHDLTKVMMNYDQYLGTANLITSEKVRDYFSAGDEIVVLTRHSDALLEALMLVGFDCNI